MDVDGRRLIQFVFATYLAQVAEVEVSRDGAVRAQRAVGAGPTAAWSSTPTPSEAQIQSAILFGMMAAPYGEITLKDERVEQTNRDTCQILRRNRVTWTGFARPG